MVWFNISKAVLPKPIIPTRITRLSNGKCLSFRQRKCRTSTFRFGTVFQQTLDNQTQGPRRRSDFLTLFLGFERNAENFLDTVLLVKRIVFMRVCKSLNFLAFFDYGFRDFYSFSKNAGNSVKEL